jgi:phytoene/squalene synthetase
MSDTANPPSLASTDDFDGRLKRTDEDRWLATRYAPEAERQLLVAIYLFNQELQRTLQTKEAMLGKIRLQWWRETLEQIAGAGPVRRHDLSEELARLTVARRDLLAPMAALVDAFDDILDDHLQSGGHQAGGQHEKRHLAVEGALMRLAGQVMDAGASADDLALLARLGEARLALVAELPGAEQSWTTARKDARKLPAALWPAVLHLAASATGAPRGALSRRWRVLRAALGRRL